MAPEEKETKAKHVGLSLEELEVLDNKVAIALAKHDEIVNGWIKASNRPPKPPVITDAEIEAQISNALGIGGGITTSAELGNKTLRSKFLPSKTLKASKARDAEEKAASARRGLKGESSDEEEGRSGLGKAKKHKQKSKVQEPVKPVAAGQEEQDSEPKANIKEASGKGQAGVESSKSKKRKSKAVVEDPVKKAKLEEKSITSKPETGSEAEKEDDLDVKMEDGSKEQKLDVDMVKKDDSDVEMEDESKEQNVDVVKEVKKGGKNDPKKEAKRRKKQLKRERKRKLQAEAEALVLKV